MADCPSHPQLEKYAARSLGPEELAAVEAHLPDCPSCLALALELEFERSKGDESIAEQLSTGSRVPARRIGAYLLLRELGRGGQGLVYLAEDTRLGRKVALEVLATGLTEIPEIRLRFEREAAALSRLDHPGLSTVYDAGREEGIAYIAMRYIEGKTLAQIIAEDAQALKQGVRPTAAHVETRVAWIEHVARSLHVAHEAGLVHRDLKPGNIMIQAEGDPVLLDFGLVHDGRSSTHRLGSWRRTSLGRGIGTRVGVGRAPKRSHSACRVQPQWASVRDDLVGRHC